MGKRPISRQLKVNLIFRKKISNNSNFFLGNYQDVVYTNKNFYMLVNNKSIYKTSIDSQVEATKWMDHVGSGWLGRTLRANEKAKQLILNKEFKSIKIIQLDNEGEPKDQFEIRGIGGLIWDHQPFGNNKVAILRRDGWLRIQEYNFERKTSKIIAESKIELSKDRAEYACTLAVCDRKKILAVHIGASDYKASRMLFFHFLNQNLKLKCDIDVLDEGVSFLQAMSFFGYNGHHLSLCALTLNNPATVMTFGYDTLLFKGEEIKRLRKQVNSSYCYKLEKVGNKLVTSDENARKITVFYKF